MSVLLKLHEVVVRRQQREILHGISLAFEPGTVTALVGPNGAGKSTLLAVAAGDLRADEGEVSLLGNHVAEVPLLLDTRPDRLGQIRQPRFSESLDATLGTRELRHSRITAERRLDRGGQRALQVTVLFAKKPH